MKKGGMRELMPETAAWIDNLRKGFGSESVDSSIRRGMRGEPVFFASENGHTIGTPVPQGVRVGTDERGNSVLLDGPQPGDPVEGKNKKLKPNDIDWEKLWQQRHK